MPSSSLRPLKSGQASSATLAARVTEVALQRIRKGSLSIASMPIAAVRCMSLLRTPDFSIKEAADVIAADAVLAARVLSISNSAAFGGAGRIKNLAKALTRLGADNLRLVLFEATAAGIFSSNDPRIREACLGLWEHSRAVAATARHVSTIVGGVDPGEAYLAGLLHDLGKPIVAAMLLKSENRLIGDKTDIWLQPETWLQIVQLAHRPVGIAVAKRWELPDLIIEAIESSSQPCLSTDVAIHCLRFANALAKKQGVYVGEIDPIAVDQVLTDSQGALKLDDADMAELLGEAPHSPGSATIRVAR